MGEYPATLYELAQFTDASAREPVIEHIMNWYENRSEYVDLVTVYICISERHRSRGERHLAARFVNENYGRFDVSHGHELDVITPAAQTIRKRNNCPYTCPDCNHQGEDNRKTVESAYDLYCERITAAMLQLMLIACNFT